MGTLKAILIDDETDSIKLMQLTLEKHFPQVTISGTFTDSTVALEQLASLEPDIVFLDIQMPQLDGFELLQKIEHLSFNVVFVTAYNEFAIRAFRFNALDYLVKPVQVEDLKVVIERAMQKAYTQSNQLATLKQQLQKGHITKIAIPSLSGVSFIDLSEIVYVEASSNYSRMKLTDGKDILISKTLKDIQYVLEEQHFLRVHRQYIINLNQVKHFDRTDMNLTMNTGDCIPVSRTQKDKLISQYGWL